MIISPRTPGVDRARPSRRAVALRNLAVCLVYVAWIAGTALLLYNKAAIWLLLAAIGTAVATYLVGTWRAFFLPVLMVPAFYIEGAFEPYDPSVSESMFGVLLSPPVWMIIFLFVFIGLVAAGKRKPAQSD